MVYLGTTNYQCLYENGAVRRIMSGSTEILRMIFSAVRDRNWGTLEPQVLSEKIEQDHSGFKVETTIAYIRNEIRFRAFYRITGSGRMLSLEMSGEALSTFLKNRIGFCVLHPIRECAGKTFTITGPDGKRHNSLFPVQISPHQPAKNIRALEWNPSGDIQAKLELKGDIFEMEDQRNWTDASYKTYCTPLDLPFPVEIRKGEKIRQKVTLTFTGGDKAETGKQDVIRVKINKDRVCSLPATGLEATSRKEPLSAAEARLLKRLNLSHLRGEIRLWEAGWQEKWDRLAAEAKALQLPLFLALYLSAGNSGELDTFVKAAGKSRVTVQYLMVLNEHHTSSRETDDMAIPRLKKLFPGVLTGAGVNANFAELNRMRPSAEGHSFAAFTISPQVHASDDLSLLENLESLPFVADSARKIYEGMPLFVSPVTLRQRFNVVATGNEPLTPQGELPPQVDVRQPTTFCAGWTAVCLRNLAFSGIHMITFFETVGWRGIFQGDYPSPLPEKFRAAANTLFPLYYVLKAIRKVQRLQYLESSDPLSVDGLAFNDGQDIMILVNFSAEIREVILPEADGLWTVKYGDSGSYRKIKKSHIHIPGRQIAYLKKL